ncbi:MAG TPA: hypothetical protein ENO00_03265 [Deltaproteobacteria bacterium]|nr:hypothetical protein [Deltaproteobacteria bacterium]
MRKLLPVYVIFLLIIMLSSVSANAQGTIRKHASPTPALHPVNCGASEGSVPFTMLADNNKQDEINKERVKRLEEQAREAAKRQGELERESEKRAVEQEREAEKRERELDRETKKHEAGLERDQKPEKVSVEAKSPLPSQLKLRSSVLKTAVVQFSERGDISTQDAGLIVAEWLTSSLSRTGAFTVYERLSFEQIMNELQMGLTGLLDEKTIVEAGKLHGVETVVVGSVTTVGSQISINARLVDTMTGRVLDTAHTTGYSMSDISRKIDHVALELATE